jgi:DNA-binding transcriptional regulator YhcF (GntR family)
VAEGLLKSGDRIPSVAELSKLCGVSKGTAMQAVSELRRQQVLISKRRSGIHVAEMMPRALEVFFGDVPRRDHALGDFLEQVLDGLKEGYQEPRRRFMVTLMNGHELNAQGLHAAAVARGVDGMVFYRPTPEIAAAAAGVARQIPCVSMIRPIPGSCCVAFTMGPPVKRLLLEEIAKGVRSFAYVGQYSLLKKEADGPYAPYAAVYDSALETLAEAGIELTLCLTPNLSTPSSVRNTEDQLLQRAAGLPAQSVVLAQTGTLALKLVQLGRGFKVITYTEYRGTLQACRGKATVLYGGLELLGQAAAQALKRAGGDPAGLQPRIVLVEPNVVE